MRGMILAAALSACAPSPPATALFAHPWPSEELREGDGTIDLSAFPTGTGAPLRRQLEDELRGVRGFGLASAIFFPFDDALDPTSLPSVDELDDASVLVVALDGPSAGGRARVDVRFLEDGGPYGGTNLLAILPYPGLPLEPETLYAAVVTTRVRDASGRALPRTEGPIDPRLEAIGLSSDEVASATLFRTGDPTRGMLDAFAYARAHDAPRLVERPALIETHDDYCVYATHVGMPDYQEGEAPYLERGGGWVWRDDGSLVLQRVERARVFLTVPRRPAPDGTHPAAVLVRAGAGGDRPLVDRGSRDRSGHSEPGTGIARELARAGYVGASVDGPLGGIRNAAAWDEQFVLFNVLNPSAFRDNLRQSALELALFAEAMAALDLDASECDGASPRVRARDELVLIGHSNGATIAPLAAAVQPRYAALVMSGAGASWIRQVVHKESPAPVRPIVSSLFGYGCHLRTFEHDPLLSLLQWAGEPADPLVYGHLLTERHVLVFQGVLDTYIPPPIASPVALSLGLDLAGDPLDQQLREWRSTLDDLALIGRGSIPLPAAANDGGLTRVVTQHPEDGVEDGHEVLFQQPAARVQLECFLRSLADGAPRVDGEEGCAG